MFDKFYKSYENSSKYKKSLSESISTAVLYTKGFSLLYLFVFVSPAFISFLMFVIFGQKEIISPIYLPYTDLVSDFGFALNSGICTILSFFGFVGFCSHDSTFVLFGYQSIPYVNILCLKLDELAEILNNKIEEIEGKNFAVKFKNYLRLKKHEKAVDDQLKEIIKLHQEYFDYIDRLTTFGGLPTFVAIFSNVIGMCLCILGSKFSFVAGVVAAIGLFIQMAIPCFMGNLVSLQSERFELALYDLPWHKITNIKTRKIFLQFVQISQDTSGLALPMLGDLDMELLSSIVNATYTYYMYILNFIE